MEDKKRVYSMRQDPPRETSPPAKKLLISTQSTNTLNGVNNGYTNSTTSTYLNEAGKIDVADPRTLEAYQKEAIFRRMLEYKREFERITLIKEELERKNEYCDGYLNIVNTYWNKMLDDLRMIIKRVDHNANLSKINLHSVRSHDSNFFKHLITIGEEEPPPSLERITQVLEEKCLLTRDVVNSVLEIIALVDEKDSTKLVESLTRKESNQKLLNKMQSQNSDLSSEVSSLKDKLQKTKNRLDETQARLEETKIELAKSEKRFDQKRCPTWGFWTPDVGGSAESESHTDHARSHDHSNIRSPEHSSPVVDQDAEKFRLLYIEREKETERQRTEIIALKSELEQSRIKYLHIPDERIAETAVFKNLQMQYYHSKENAEQCRSIIESMSRDLEELKGSRRAFQEQAEKEANQKVLDITKEMQLLENDLNRIRALRDAAIHDAELAKARNGPGFQQIPALRRLANGRKSQLRRLMDDIRLENAKAAYEARDMESLEFYSNEREPTEDTDLYKLKYSMSLVANLKGQIRELKEENTCLRVQLDSYKDAPSEIKHAQERRLSERNYRKDVEMLKQRIDEYDDKYGIRDPGDDPLHILAAKIEEKDKKIADLSNELRLLKIREKTHVRDLTALDEEIQQLDEKANQKMFDIIKHENELMRLAEMKNKAEQKCQGLTNKYASLEQQNKDYAALRLRMEENIRQQEYQIKNLQQQLGNMEKDSAAADSLITTYRLKIQDLTHENTALREKYSKTEHKYNEIYHQYRERYEQCENEISLRRKTQEETAVYKKRLEDISKQQLSGSSKSVLQAELDGYKAKAEERFRNAQAALQEFEDGEAQGILLGKLRLKWLNEGLNEGQQRLWETLEEEKKRLEEDVRDCRKHVEELQKALAHPGNDFVTRALGT
ncbi:7144_t:CDS:10 [Ambispora gerdemannii]|uniref:E3 ubiquitin protein ligase n=1 Tax=Ambispora gerdemannii TaxID=144530 RepID=A0A9N9AJ50_9GLOM|nr:7144_t:CDS:10 [Ambispora gerdemannii]